MIIKIILVLSVVGIIVGLLLYIKSGWNSKTERVDPEKAEKRWLYIAIGCFLVFYFGRPKSHSQVYTNSYFEFGATFSVDDTEKKCTISLNSKKAYPPAAVFTEEIIKESRIFLDEWPNIESIQINTKCSKKILNDAEVKYLKQPAKKDQFAELGYNIGLYSMIDACTF